jgi:hypothetical protein
MKRCLNYQIFSPTTWGSSFHFKTHLRGFGLGLFFGRILLLGFLFLLASLAFRSFLVLLLLCNDKIDKLVVRERLEVRLLLLYGLLLESTKLLLNRTFAPVSCDPCGKLNEQCLVPGERYLKMKTA